MCCYLASAARSLSSGTGTCRGRFKIHTYLFVVGARNSDDQGRVGFCRRLSGERCGRGGPIREEIGPPLPSHVSFDTARSDGFWFIQADGVGGGGLLSYGQPRGDVARMAYRWYNTRRRTAAYGYHTDLAPKARNRTNGETSAMREIYV